MADNICPFCLTDNIGLVGKSFDDRYAYVGYFERFQCNICGHQFLCDNFSPNELVALYSTYYPRSTFDLDSHTPHQTMIGVKAFLDGARSSAFRWVPRNVRVLDIGCGFGETLGYHKSRGCEVIGVEADENIQRVAEKFGYTVRVGLFDPADFEPDYFDYVTMDQVLEHTQNPVQVLKGIEYVLKPGGVAVLSLPNASGWGAWLFGKRWINWHAPYHLQFFTRDSMSRAAKLAGLQVEQHQTLTPSGWLAIQWAHLIAYPKPGVPSKFWKQSGGYSIIQKILLRVAALANKFKINHMLTRLFDSVGLGDNHLFVLRKPQ